MKTINAELAVILLKVVPGYPARLYRTPLYLQNFLRVNKVCKKTRYVYMLDHYLPDEDEN
jgi:hypothetical protein